MFQLFSYTNDSIGVLYWQYFTLPNYDYYYKPLIIFEDTSRIKFTYLDSTIANINTSNDLVTVDKYGTLLKRTVTSLNIPTNTNQLTNGAGFITTIPAQSFSSLTGKPTTISGYGIIDAYPLSGNPSGFLSGITSSQITTALTYTPYNGSTNPNSYLSSEIDGSITNEIELPSQTGNNNKYLTTNGSIPSWNQLNIPIVYKYNSGASPTIITSKIISGRITTNSSGVASINLTTDGTSTGTSLFTNIYSIIATAELNTGILTSIPLSSVKQIISGKVYEVNAVESAGILLGGQGLELCPSGITINITVIGD